MSTPAGASGISAVRSVMTWLASLWTFARRPRTKGLPIKRKITKPKIGVTMIRSNQAMEDDGRRLPGTVPSATILIINSTRYKINGAQAIALTVWLAKDRIGTNSIQAFSHSRSIAGHGRPHLPHGPVSRSCGWVGRCAKLVPELVGEFPGGVQLLAADVRTWNLHAEIAVPVLARAQIADQRQERPHLTTRVLEVDAVQEFPASLGAEPANGLQIVTPVASADDEAGERFAGERPGCHLRFEEGTNGDVRRQPPRRGTDDNEVVVPLSHSRGDLDGSRSAAELGRDHPQYLEERVRHWKFREPPRVAGVGEDDVRQLNVASSFPQHGCHDVEDFLGLSCVRVVHEQ